MRFTPYLTVLAAIAAITSALPVVDIRWVTIYLTSEKLTGLKLNKTYKNLYSNSLSDFNNNNRTALIDYGVISYTSLFETTNIWRKLSEATGIKRRTTGLLGFDDNDEMEMDDVFYVRGDTFLAAEEVKAGQKVKVYNLSGCSVIFVIGADGKPTTFHITAGKETALARSAATYIQARKKSHNLTPKTILVYTRERATENYNDIVKALGEDLAKLVDHQTYGYNPTLARMTTRWQLVLTVGTTNVKAEQYDITKDTYGI